MILGKLRRALLTAYILLDRFEEWRAPPKEPEPLPNYEDGRCFRCSNRLSYPHFSCEEYPKMFCTWFCASKYHQAHNCGVYKIEAGQAVFVENDGSARLIIDTTTMRPVNHPLRD